MTVLGTMVAGIVLMVLSAMGSRAALTRCALTESLFKSSLSFVIALIGACTFLGGLCIFILGISALAVGVL